MIAEPGRFQIYHPVLDRTSRFVLDPDRPFMDLTTVNNVDQGVLQTKAIYELRGDVLTYCVAPVGQERPTAMTTQAGDGQTLVSLKRQRGNH